MRKICFIAILRQYLRQIIIMKILSDHLLNLIDYSKNKGYSDYKTNIIRGEHIDVTLYLDYYKDLFIKSDNQYFGLYFGFFLNLKALGSVYDVSLSASSIGQVISLWSNYSDLNLPLVKFHSFSQNDKFILELDSDLKDISIKNQILDTIFTFVFRELNMMIGDNEVEISLPYQNCNEYNTMFGCKATYSDKHTFVFNKEILNDEINKDKKKIIEILLPNFLKLLNKKEKESFSFLIKQMILNMCNPELPTLKQVSVQFSMTERTLQRRLKTEGTSFRSITNEIKSELSKYLKKGKKIKTKDIAFLLGYSSASSFLHANKKWQEV